MKATLARDSKNTSHLDSSKVQKILSTDYSDAGENEDASSGETETETSSQSEKTTARHEEKIESTSHHTPSPVPCDTNTTRIPLFSGKNA
jgi:hypothetical protein